MTGVLLERANSIIPAIIAAAWLKLYGLLLHLEVVKVTLFPHKQNHTWVSVSSISQERIFQNVSFKKIWEEKTGTEPSEDFQHFSTAKWLLFFCFFRAPFGVSRFWSTEGSSAVVWLYTYRRFNHAFHLENLPLKEIKVVPLLGWWKKTMRFLKVTGTSWMGLDPPKTWDFCCPEILAWHSSKEAGLRAVFMGSDMAIHGPY